jgi:hypothetical protein
MKVKEITIKAIDRNKREYLAFYKHEFFKTTFAVFFNDSIVGAVSLTHFFEMIRMQFAIEHLEIVVSNEMYELKNPALLDILSMKEEAK